MLSCRYSQAELLPRSYHYPSHRQFNTRGSDALEKEDKIVVCFFFTHLFLDATNNKNHQCACDMFGSAVRFS